MTLQILLNFVLSSYHSHSIAPLDALVVVASVGAPLQIDADWRTQSKNRTTFHTICSGAPTVLPLQQRHVACGVML
jgi:hypothetical protein